MKKYWYLFALIGVIFGIIDWFYLDWLAWVSWGAVGETIFMIPLAISLNYGIWLVPIIPVVIVASRKGNKIWDPVVLGIITWLSAMLSYYTYYAILLSTGKLPHLEHLNIFADTFPEVRTEYWRMFKRIIFYQWLEWSVIAIIAGGVIGALGWWVFRKKSNRFVGDPSRLNLYQNNGILAFIT